MLNHYIHPSLEMCIDKTKELIKMWVYEYIYLATEDYEALLRFNRENDKYLRGLEYLVTISLLAKCESLIDGQCNGTVGAVLLNNKYKHEYIFDLGRYK